MEPPQSLDANSPEAQGRARPSKLVVVWLVIVAGAAAYGYLIDGQTDQIGLSLEFSREMALKASIAWTAVGFGVATCVTLGWWILTMVRSRDLKKGWAILFLALSSLGSIVSTPVVLTTAEGLFSIPPDGHSGFIQLLYLPLLTLFFAVVAFVSFTVSVLCARTRVDSHPKEAR